MIIKDIMNNRAECVANSPSGVRFLNLFFNLMLDEDKYPVYVTYYKDDFVYSYDSLGYEIYSIDEFTEKDIKILTGAWEIQTLFEKGVLAFEIGTEEELIELCDATGLDCTDLDLTYPAVMYYDEETGELAQDIQFEGIVLPIDEI